MHISRRKIVLLVSIVLALTAITVISWDYTCGHMDQNPAIPNHCPLCTAYASLTLALVFIIFDFIIHKLHEYGVIHPNGGFSSVAVYLSIFSLRAPPAAA